MLPLLSPKIWGAGCYAVLYVTTNPGVGHFSECLLSVEEQYKQLVEQQQLLSIRLSSSHLQVCPYLCNCTHHPVCLSHVVFTQLHPLLDITKHNSSITEGMYVKTIIVWWPVTCPVVGEMKAARLLEADSQCGEESMPQLPVLPGITTTDNSSKTLKKMDTVTSLPSLEAKTGQSDDNMIRSHSELCLQNGGGNKVKSTVLPKISKNSGKTQHQQQFQPKYSTATAHMNSLAPVRPANGKGPSTKPFVDSPPSLQLENTNSHNRNFVHTSNQAKNSGRGHFEMKKGVAMDTKVPSSMRKKLLNQNTRRHAINMGETSVSISKPIDAHHRRKTAKREPIKKIPLPIKGLCLSKLV